MGALFSLRYKFFLLEIHTELSASVQSPSTVYIVSVHPPSKHDRRRGRLAPTVNIRPPFSILIRTDLSVPSPVFILFFSLLYSPFTHTRELIKVLQGSAAVYWLQLPDSIYFYGIVRIFILRSPYYKATVQCCKSEPGYVTNKTRRNPLSDLQASHQGSV